MENHPIHRAARDGDAIQVRSLVSQHPHFLNAIQDGYTPLMRAAQQGHSHVVEALVSLGADLDLQTEHATTAVHVACKFNVPCILQILADAGADVDIPCHSSFIRPLMWAVHHEAQECVALLVTRYRDAVAIDAQDADGDTALHYAVDRGTRAALAILLLAEANPCIENDDGLTPFDSAEFHENSEFMLILEMFTPPFGSSDDDDDDDDDATVVESYQTP
jgi:ankyrin repeat protein